MGSYIFTEPLYAAIEQNVIQTINAADDIVGSASLDSPRAVGDAVQSLLEQRFASLLPADAVKNYSAAYARRAMEDFAFEDKDGFYYVVDCKTHNVSTKFSMPNLISVERLARFYQEQRNYFTILLVDYEVKQGKIEAKQCRFLPVEHLAWSCLTIGALGWGQLQIANANCIEVDRRQTRKGWMLSLCDHLSRFYPGEILKINDRIAYFEQMREFWLQQEDN